MRSIGRSLGAGPRSNCAGASGWVLPCNTVSLESFTTSVMRGGTLLVCAEAPADRNNKPATIDNTVTEDLYLNGIVIITVRCLESSERIDKRRAKNRRNVGLRMSQTQSRASLKYLPGAEYECFGYLRC